MTQKIYEIKCQIAYKLTRILPAVQQFTIVLDAISYVKLTIFRFKTIFRLIFCFTKIFEIIYSKKAPKGKNAQRLYGQIKNVSKSKYENNRYKFPYTLWLHLHSDC